MLKQSNKHTIGDVLDCFNTREMVWILQLEQFLVFGLAFQYDRVINKVVKFSTPLDWKSYHSEFITVPYWNKYYLGVLNVYS